MSETHTPRPCKFVPLITGRRANAHPIAAAADYWDAAEQMTTDATELEGDDAGYVAVSKEAYDALMRAHASANGEQWTPAAKVQP